MTIIPWRPCILGVRWGAKLSKAKVEIFSSAYGAPCFYQSSSPNSFNFKFPVVNRILATMPDEYGRKVIVTQCLLVNINLWSSSCSICWLPAFTGFHAVSLPSCLSPSYPRWHHWAWRPVYLPYRYKWHRQLQLSVKQSKRQLNNEELWVLITFVFNIIYFIARLFFNF